MRVLTAEFARENTQKFSVERASPVSLPGAAPKGADPAA